MRYCYWRLRSRLDWSRDGLRLIFIAGDGDSTHLRVRSVVVTTTVAKERALLQENARFRQPVASTL